MHTEHIAIILNIINIHVHVIVPLLVLVHLFLLSINQMDHLHEIVSSGKNTDFIMFFPVGMM